VARPRAMARAFQRAAQSRHRRHKSLGLPGRCLSLRPRVAFARTGGVTHAGVGGGWPISSMSPGPGLNGPPSSSTSGNRPPATRLNRVAPTSTRAARWDRDGRAPCFAEVEEEGRPFRPGPGDMEQSRVPCRPDPVRQRTKSFASLRLTVVRDTVRRASRRSREACASRSHAPHALRRSTRARCGRARP